MEHRHAPSAMLNDTNRLLFEELGIPCDYGLNGCPPNYPEASELVDVGPNLMGRIQSLTPIAATCWRNMLEASGKDGIQLLIVSGFRTLEYQAELIRRKLQAGQSIGEILRVNAAPGFSQHHSGTAVDVASPGTRPLTEEFELSDAFDWLSQNAADFGFSMTYPRENEFGLIYEPWHWALAPENRVETG